MSLIWLNTDLLELTSFSFLHHICDFLLLALALLFNPCVENQSKAHLAAKLCPGAEYWCFCWKPMLAGELWGHPCSWSGTTGWSPGRGDDKSCPSCHSGCIPAHQQTAQMRYLGSLLTSSAQKRWSQISKTVEECTEEWRGSQRSNQGYVHAVFWRRTRTYSSHAVSQREVSSMWTKRHETKLLPSSKPVSSGSVMSYPGLHSIQFASGSHPPS